MALAQPSGLGLVALLMLLQAATEVVVARNYALALLFITPLALINSTAGHAGSSLVPVEGRMLDTLLGAGLALAVFGGARPAPVCQEGRGYLGSFGNTPRAYQRRIQ